MGKFDKILKTIGAAIDSHPQDAKKILELVDSPEIAVALKGKQKEHYLNALDTIYGEKTKRAKDLGFDLSKEQFHGTQYKDGQIDEFRPSGTRKGDVYKYGPGVYTTPHTGMAEQYAGFDAGATYPLVIKDKKNFNPADFNLAKDVVKNSGVELTPAELKKRYRSTEEGMDLLEKKLGKNEYHKELDKQGYRVGLEDDGIYVSKPEDVRSKFASFDPRFKDSAKLLAGAGAMNSSDMSLGTAYKNFKQDIAEPIAGAWEKAKSFVTDPLSKVLDLTKDGSAREGIKTGLDIGLDPTNLLGGVPAAVAGGVQLMGSKDPEIEAKKAALKRLSGE